MQELPESDAESGSVSKLGLHAQEGGAYELLAFLRRFQTPMEYVVLLDPPGDAARDISALGVKIIARHYTTYDFSPDTARAAFGWLSAQAKAGEFVQECSVQPWYEHVWALMTPPAMVNTSTPDLFPWAIAFWQEAQRLFAGDGKECLVGNWSNTHHGFLVLGAKYYGCQEYGGEGWPLVTIPTHYREWFPQVLSQDPDAKLFVLECGVTALEAPQEVKDGYDHSNDGPGKHGLDIGYRGGHGIPAVGSGEFLAPLLAYAQELEADAYVLGGAAFGYGMNPDWESHDTAGDTVVEEGLILAMIDSGPQDGLIGGIPMPVPEYGFAGLFDGFDALVAEIGVARVGKPRHSARYLGGDYAYQVTEKGRLEAVKLDDGSWSSAFYENSPKA